MSWRDAPLYVEAHDLSRWVIEHANSWPVERDRHLGRPVAEAACGLLTAVSLALTFPATRFEHLRSADHEIVRLRVLLRVARELRLVSPRGLRYASARLRTVGRMVGGWLKRVEARPLSAAAGTTRGRAPPATTA